MIVAFADLRHTNHGCQAVPYGAALVAAYARQELGSAIEPRLFKDPAAFARFLDGPMPRLMCFSAYLWNTNLAYAFARRIKARAPETLIVFGGPNLPLDEADRRDFLRDHPAIDVFVVREGEAAFAGLFRRLAELDFDPRRFRNEGGAVAGCCHLDAHGALIDAEAPPLIMDLDRIPSPYLAGMCDEFLADSAPILETTRGCPFRCTFCQDGGDHAKRVRRYSPQRVAAEVAYLAARSRTPQLQMADLNFGMYREDLETCRVLAEARRAHDWPKMVNLCGKNQKERVLEAARIIAEGGAGGAAVVVAAVQSTDPEVLKAVKRQNVRTGDMVEIAKASEALGSSSFSEIILGLPGDSLASHQGSIYQLMDMGIDVVRSHQFILLPGAEASTRASRAEFQMRTVFRVMPYTAAPYALWGETFAAPEIDEICVASATLPFDDYVEARLFDLCVEIFYNNGIFRELYRLLDHVGIPPSRFFARLFAGVQTDAGPLARVVADFKRETAEFWDSRAEVESFLAVPGNLDRYRRGELGNNEQLMYRAVAIVRHMADLHRVAFAAAAEVLGEARQRYGVYLDQLRAYSLARKDEFIAARPATVLRFDFDFPGLAAAGFAGDPLAFRALGGVGLRIAHSPAQRALIEDYRRQFGATDSGLAHMLGGDTHVAAFFRGAEAA